MTPAHLVARALRDRRTVVHRRPKRLLAVPRPQPDTEVRDTPAGQFNYGVTYDASRPNTTLRYGLEAYATTKC